MKHLVFIVNPHAGVDRVKEIQNAITRNIDNGLYTYEVQHTLRARHGVELATVAAATGAWAVVAVGGDGSVNDVMQGLLGTKAILGIIPRGSGNGMARNLGIPLELNAAMKVINDGNVETTDIAYAGDRPFVSNAGVAFDAQIAHEFAASKRRGLLIYSWLVTRNLWAYKSKNYTITVDGQAYSEKAFMVVVANGRQFGYNFQIAPMASHDDGLLDVVIIREFPRLMGAAISWRALTGTLNKSSYVRHLRGTDITISHPSLQLMQVDGDAHHCENDVRFTISPGALHVLAPVI